MQTHNDRSKDLKEKRERMKMKQPSPQLKSIKQDVTTLIMSNTGSQYDLKSQPELKVQLNMLNWHQQRSKQKFQSQMLTQAKSSAYLTNRLEQL